MNFKDDFGYFGSGLDGYAHYKQAFDSSFSALSDDENINLDDLSFDLDSDDSADDDGMDDGENDLF